MKKENHDNLVEVEEVIKSFSKPSITFDRGKKIKNNLFNSIESLKIEGQFSKGFDEVRGGLEIESQKRAYLKEKLIDRFEKKNNSFFSWKFVFALPFAVLVLFVVLFDFKNDDFGSTVIENENSEEFVAVDSSPVNDARDIAVIEENISFVFDVQGEAFLERGDQLIKVENGAEIFERDKLIVKNGASLALQLFDDKKFFLHENTSLKIEDLLDQEEMKLISLNLDHGELYYDPSDQFVDSETPIFVNVKDYSFVSSDSEFSLQYDGNQNFELDGERVIVIADQGLAFSSGLIAFENGDFNFDSLDLDFEFVNYKDDRALVDKSLAYFDFSELQSQKISFDLAEVYFHFNRSTQDRVLALDQFVKETDALYKLISEVKMYDRDFADILEDQIDSKMYAYSDDLEFYFDKRVADPDSDFDAEVLVEGEIDPAIFDRFINSDFPTN